VNHPTHPRETFLVERYVERQLAPELDPEIDRARAAGRELTAAGRPTSYVRTIVVPEDETCFHMFASSSPHNVAEACRRAGIAYDRILEAIDPSEVTARSKEEGQ
jgi:hypothetical protein